MYYSIPCCNHIAYLYMTQCVVTQCPRPHIYTCYIIMQAYQCSFCVQFADNINFNLQYCIMAIILIMTGKMVLKSGTLRHSATQNIFNKHCKQFQYNSIYFFQLVSLDNEIQEQIRAMGLILPLLAMP